MQIGVCAYQESRRLAYLWLKKIGSPAGRYVPHCRGLKCKKLTI